MMLEVRKLKNDQGSALLSHYKTAGYKHQSGWQTCYCQFYMMPAEQFNASTAKERETALLTEVEDGSMQGYAAMDDVKIVGWCLANQLGVLVRKPRIHALVDDPEKTAYIGCFVVNHAYRNQGLATRLLAFALEDLRSQEYRQVLAKPNAGAASHERMYAGTPSMYEKAGFTKLENKAYRNLVSLMLV